MTQARAARDDHPFRVLCDVVEVSRFFVVVKNRATGSEHSLSYDNILIGSSDEGDFYEVVMPGWLASEEGLQ